MKPLITILITILLYSLTSFSQIIKWEDGMNGDNSIAGLQARGWIILNEDGGGTTPPWFQGRISRFFSFEGPDSGYVAADWAGANDNGIIDQWLISPAITVSSQDTLIFWAYGSQSYDDSINIMYSASAGTVPSTFVSLGRYLVPKDKWDDFFVFNFPSNATIRFAIRYYIFEGGIFGSRSDYIGLDGFKIYTNVSNYPSSISVNKTFSYADITQSSSYRMVGLPGQLNLPISQQITGTRGTDWNAYYDDGTASDYLVEYNGSANFNFKPGNGFWLLSKNAVTVSVQVSSVPLAGDNTYSISLHSGWNIIANPFERSTNWSAVQTANGLAGNAVIYDWAGAWSNPTSFLTNKGYYFNNTAGLTSLKIPYDAGGILGKSSNEGEFKISSEDNIKISLLLVDEEKSGVLIGFSPEASNDFDNHDYFAPPGDFQEARIVIRNDNLSTNYKYLMKESRSEIGDGQIYYLDVKNLTGQEVTLKFEGISHYSNYHVCLIDERLNNEFRVTDNSEFEIPVNVKRNKFRFLIGTQQFIETTTSNLTPTSFTLYQNYPNPFNPTTTIRYSIPSVSIVNIKIYDLLGNELMTLIDEEKNPGYYELEFNAEDFASGVYVCRIKANNFIDSKKMILLR